MQEIELVPNKDIYFLGGFVFITSKNNRLVLVKCTGFYFHSFHFTKEKSFVFLWNGF